MSQFSFKKIEQYVPLGTIFKNQREKQGFNLEDITRKTRIPLPYLNALEENNFSTLPRATGYRLAYVKHYAVVLGLDGRRCAHKFIEEAGLTNAAKSVTTPRVRFFPGGSLVSLIRNIALIGFVFLIIGYLVWQIKGIMEPPKLTIFSPYDGYTTNEKNILLQGTTDTETQLLVNGENVMVNNQGQFQVNVALSNGLNTLNIKSIKKHGKTTEMTRHIISKADPTSLPPNF